MYPYIFFLYPFWLLTKHDIDFLICLMFPVLILYSMLHLFFQMDSPFLPKLTSCLHFFIFFPLHHHPRRKHPNSTSPSDSSLSWTSDFNNLPFCASLGNFGVSVPFVVSVLWVPSALWGAQPVSNKHSVLIPLSRARNCTHLPGH
jgi:hypothetical protein